MSEVKNKRIAKFREADLYLVITKEFTAGRGTLRVLEEAADAGIRLVQLREKSITKKELFHLAEQFRKICDRYDITMIMNDHIDIALLTGADGVHIGQDDLPLEQAVRLAPDLIIRPLDPFQRTALEAGGTGCRLLESRSGLSDSDEKHAGPSPRT